MSKFHFVSSLSPRLWEKYAHATLGTFISHFNNEFPEDVDSFAIWLDHAVDVEPFAQMLALTSEQASKFKFGSLDTLAEFVGFSRMYADNVPFNERGINPDKLPKGGEFRFNYMPFAKKVFSWAATYMNIPENDYMVWIDADIILDKPLTKEFFDQFREFDLVFLDRDFPWYAAETGFFILKRTPAMDRFVQLMLHMYITGFVFDMAEWHDGYIFKTAMKLGIDPSLKVLNLVRTMKERDVFERTLLADFMTHLKGGKKSVVKQSMLGEGDGDVPTLINFDPEDQ